MTTNENGPWPLWVQVGVLLFALLLAAVLVVFPVVGLALLERRYDVQPTADSVWEPMIAILLGLTTMTVSGIFVFMTFRIDRGARTEARKVAAKVVNTMKREAIEEVQSLIRGLLDASQAKVDDDLVKVGQRIVKAKDTLQEEVKKAVKIIDEARKTGTAEVERTLAQGAEGVQRMLNDTQRHIADLGERMEGSVDDAGDAMKKEVDAGRKQIRQIFENGTRELAKVFEEAKKGPDPKE